MEKLNYNKESILELQRIIAEDYGQKISFEEATEATHNLVGFFDLLLKIDLRQKQKPTPE